MFSVLHYNIILLAVSVNVLLLVCTVWSHVHVKNVSPNQYMKTPSFKLASRLNPATLLLLPPKLLKPPIPLKRFEFHTLTHIISIYLYIIYLYIMIHGCFTHYKSYKKRKERK